MENPSLNFSLARTNRTFIGRWWWTIDTFSLFLIFLLMGIGSFLVLAASPSVAENHTWQTFYFVKRHLTILGPSIVLMVTLSSLSLKNVQRVSLLLFAGGLILLLLTLFWGIEIKGARRWIGLKWGFSLQPSEFMKPVLAVLCAWMFSEKQRLGNFPGNMISFFLMAVVIVLLLLQPDFGMSFLMVATWLVQFFLSGVSLWWVGGLAGLGSFGLVGAYFCLPHVRHRIHIFLHPEIDRFGEQFQIFKSLDAFSNGGFWGQGPGEGVVKHSLPDAHADFIFAVAGEEFGFVLCFSILLLFGGLILRSSFRILRQKDFFITLAAAGLIVQLAFQVFINTASTLNLIPPKGMTLPFISYGGSSLLSASIAMGFLLAFTRERVTLKSPLARLFHR
jgi:cell division protein FtsW